MFDAALYEPAAWDETEAALARGDPIAWAGGKMARYAEVFLAGVCADHLALAGFGLVRRTG